VFALGGPFPLGKRRPELIYFSSPFNEQVEFVSICTTLSEEVITVGLEALALAARIFVTDLSWSFDNKTGSLLGSAGIAKKLDVFLTTNGAFNAAFVLLSVRNVTVCGSATFAGLYQHTVCPWLIRICFG